LKHSPFYIRTHARTHACPTTERNQTDFKQISDFKQVHELVDPEKR